MTLVDVLIIIGILIGVRNGFRNGAIKQLTDVLFLYVSMIGASLLSGFIANFLYSYLPFLNLLGSAKGLKTINILIYRVLIYIILIFVFLKIIRKILYKFKIDERIANATIRANIPSKIVGTILGIPMALLVIHNFILATHIPIFNVDLESNIAGTVMEYVPLVSSNNYAIYDSEMQVLELIKSDSNNEEEYESVNEEILMVLIDNEIISDDSASTLEEKEKLLGNKKTKSYFDNLFDDNDDDYEDDDYEEDDDYIDDEEDDDYIDDDYEEEDDYIDDEEDEYSFDEECYYNEILYCSDDDEACYEEAYNMCSFE